MIQIITIAALIVGLLVSIGNLAVMIYALTRFLSKPRNELEARVLELEVLLKEVKESLLKGNDKFRSYDAKFETQEKANEVMLHSLMALIAFEIEYCLTEHKMPSDDLKQAKDNLNLFLARKRG